MTWRFLVYYFLERCSEWIEVYFRLWSFSLFYHATYLFDFTVLLSSFPYFAPKLFCFLLIRFLVCFRTFSPNLVVDFFFVGMSCFVCIVLSCLDINLVFLFLSVPSGLFPRVVLFFLLVELLFSFCPNIFQCSSVLSFYYYTAPTFM